MIIGINGKIGSGKDTVGKIIQGLVIGEDLFENGIVGFLDSYDDLEQEDNRVEWKIKKFAGKLKQFASMLTGISVEDLEKEEVKDSYLGKEWWYYRVPNTLMTTFTTYFANDTIPYLDVKNKLVEIHDSFILNKTTVREFLQKLGTEAIRNNIHENAWVNALMVDYKKELTSGWVPSYNNPDNKNLEPNAELEYPNWIITDMRFPNELKAVKDRDGISIKVKRYPQKLTVSRGGFDSTDIPFNINNPKHKDLYEAEILNSHISETALDKAEFDYVIDNNGTINELINKVKEILIKEKII